MKEQDRLKFIRKKTKNIASNWIQAMNDGYSLMSLIKKMMEVRNVKWTCDFLRANPQLKKFYNDLSSVQKSQKMSQQKIGEEKYRLY